MGQDIAIDVHNVSKCYRRYHHPVDRFKELVWPKKLRGEEFWALRRISFQVKQGESVGILGQNGSGKSTLLQIITQTLTPTEGTVGVAGRVSALLELGSGFNPDFTGRQNVMVNGRILGFRRKEVEAKLDDIIEFAEIGDFIDQPVHTYSSGMFVRLAFAAAVVWEPEILIVDEALAVGDVFFQQKCFARIKALQKQGVTLLFVSHDTQSILNLCDRAVVLNHGQLLYLGAAPTAVERYFELYYMSHESERPSADPPLAFTPEPFQSEVRVVERPLPFVTDFSGKNRYGNAVGLIQGICITDQQGLGRSAMSIYDELVISIQLGPYSPSLAPLNVGIQLRDRLGQLIIGSNTKMLSQDLTQHPPGEPFICQFRFRPQIAPGEYTLGVAVAENKLEATTIYDWINNALPISLTAGTHAHEQGGLCRPEIAVTTYRKAARV
ncbi:MAG: ABC transporter ATP-binding protein [Nodosilinea sp.]